MTEAVALPKIGVGRLGQSSVATTVVIDTSRKVSRRPAELAGFDAVFAARRASPQD
jgi:hypothetical protein